MFCNNCGNQIPDNSTFCPNCGAAFSQPQQPQYQPQYPQQPGGYVPPQQPASEPGKGMATASMILGILSFFCFAYIAGTLGIIFGCVAKNQGYKGKMATAGIICGIIGIVLWVVMQIVGVSLLATLGYY